MSISTELNYKGSQWISPSKVYGISVPANPSTRVNITIKSNSLTLALFKLVANYITPKANANVMRTSLIAFTAGILLIY